MIETCGSVLIGVNVNFRLLKDYMCVFVGVLLK